MMVDYASFQDVYIYIQMPVRVDVARPGLNGRTITDRNNTTGGAGRVDKKIP